ncbi:hypothetical protein ACET3Z_032596 [Daucus carota]
MRALGYMVAQCLGAICIVGVAAAVCVSVHSSLFHFPTQHKKVSTFTPSEGFLISSNSGKILYSFDSLFQTVLVGGLFYVFKAKSLIVGLMIRGSARLVLDSRRVSCSVVEPDYCWIDDNRVVQVNVQSERDCRICQLSVEMDAAHQENGIAIELGCSCKDDLAAAHKHCAEAWFKIKGNKLYLLYWLWLW